MNHLLSHLSKPKTIDDIIGQKHLVDDKGLIRKMIESNELFSIIFFGLPGTGKTSLANAICNQLNVKHGHYNPTINKKIDLEKLLHDNINDFEKYVIIIDEIHRMNRDKQDILLSYLEKGNLVIFGTTTENPYFVVNPAIRSRCYIAQTKPLDADDIFEGLEKISRNNDICLSKDKLQKISINCQGDLRQAINILDIVKKIYNNAEPTKEEFDRLLSNSNVIGSSFGNEFYDLQSAFHKSLRGSDINASIYYLARLIKIGDLNSISRRMIAMAYEDVGLANPNLISRVVLGVNSAERLGFPEANQILSELVIELCLSPKSNSAYLAISKALKDIDNNGTGAYDIPNHLKDTHYKSASKLGYKGYKYPHDYKNNWVDQNYLPNQLIGTKYYEVGNNEIEQKMNKILNDRKK